MQSYFDRIGGRIQERGDLGYRPLLQVEQHHDLSVASGQDGDSRPHLACPFVADRLTI